MKFGVREICDVFLKAKVADQMVGNTKFAAGQPVCHFDSLKTSTVEGAATTVYAQGGKGNARLIAWEGEKTLTFTVEDALLSPIGLSVLAGAGLIKGNDNEMVHVHMVTTAYVGEDGKIDLSDALAAADEVCADAPLFVMGLEEDGSLTGEIFSASVTGNEITAADAKGKTVMVDYYVKKKSADVSEIQIDAENFAGYYYVEAETLFRRQDNGVDMPANITLPNVKIQSNFTFSMASTGDPSTFTFTMDAMPGYTYFDKKKKVLCVIQVVEDSESAEVKWDSVMAHQDAEEELETKFEDSNFVPTEE